MKESIEPKKFARSFFEAIPWMKTVRHFIGIVIIILIGLTIYLAYFKPHKQQNVHIGNVESGGTVVIEADSPGKTGLEFFITSNDVGAQFIKSIDANWYAGLGAQYDFKSEEIRPRVSIGVGW